MKIALFYHSVLSDWNHGNAHFLRGVATEMAAMGHEVAIYEPEDSWSYANLVQEHGTGPVEEVQSCYPLIRAERYREFDPDRMLDGVSLAIVHEWNSPQVISRLGGWRAYHPELRLLFHDTHHRAVTAPEELQAMDLRHYDGVLAYGRVLERLYLEHGWAQRAWTWHEAADTRIFRPLSEVKPDKDLVWIGNWGDDERTAELHEYLIEPCRTLGLKATVHGVRYPDVAKQTLREAGISFEGWLPNYRVPQAFARARVTVHVPRRPYVAAMPGIPTIRPFEALACGIPMITAPWPDVEHLFRPGKDFLVANSGKQMALHLRTVLNEPDLAQSLACDGRSTILSRHTCAHRVRELLAIYDELTSPAGAERARCTTRQKESAAPVLDGSRAG
jgi:spore maturation protein CgeB